MTRFVPLAERRPRDGQRVEYRLRPGDPVEAAVFDATRPAWVTASGHAQTARPHQEWRATTPGAHLDPHLRRELRATLELHPDLIDELDAARADAGIPWNPGATEAPPRWRER